MNLYDRCVDLALRLEAAQSADASTALLASGENLANRLSQATEYLSSTIRFRADLSAEERPAVDLKAVTRTVNAFRGALASRGAAAFQQQHATNVSDVATRQRDVASRWVIAKWKGLFAEYDGLIARVRTEPLVGNMTQQRLARSRAQTLATAAGLDPITKADELQAVLGYRDVISCMSAIHMRGAELRQALEALDAERAAFSPEVRTALHRASSEDGLPLSDLTDDLLRALRTSGVDDQLIVRRQ